MSVWSGIFGFLGTIAQGIFGSSKKKAEVVETALGILKEANKTEAAALTAASAVIVAEAQSESGLTRVWRPLIMLMFAGLIVASFFGYYPPFINEPMSPMIGRLFDLMEIGIGGYIGGRTIEKVAREIKIGSILKKMVDKYI